MILVDTNILVDYIRSAKTDDLDIFHGGGFAICGVVEAEFLCGTRSKREVAWLYGLLERMKYIKMEPSDWEGVGFLMRTLREKGIAVPMPDGIISYLAIKHDLDVWTHDRHFLLIAAAMPDLKLLNA